MKQQGTITTLVVIIAVAATVAALTGIFSSGGPGPQTHETFRGTEVTLYGRGIYRHMSADVAIQGIGQDVVTVGIAVPLLLLALFRARGGVRGERSVPGPAGVGARRSARGAAGAVARDGSRSGNGRSDARPRLVLSGVLLYLLVTYTFYLAMATYNALFLVYALLMGCSFFALALVLLDVGREMATGGGEAQDVNREGAAQGAEATTHGRGAAHGVAEPTHGRGVTDGETGAAPGESRGAPAAAASGAPTPTSASTARLVLRAPGSRRLWGAVLIANAALIGLLWLSVVVPPLVDGTVYPAAVQHYTTLIVQGFDLGLLLPASVVIGVLLRRETLMGLLFGPVYLVFLSLIMTALIAKLIAMELNGVPTAPAIFIIPVIAVVAITGAVRMLPRRS